VLQDSGTGHPAHDGIQIRNQLRNLGQQYGVPVWLTEVSHGKVGGVQGNTFDALRARAIQMHDDLNYADMAGFFFQGAYWDRVLQRNHFGTDLTLDQLQAEDGDAFVVIGDPTTDTWQLTMGAYALGHYSRWVRPGDVRVDAASDDPLVQVTAFRDDAQGTESFVLINNSSQDQEVTLSLAGALFGGDLTGEQSTAGALWSPLDGITPTDPSTVTLILPAQSVTSLSAPLDSGPPAPVPSRAHPVLVPPDGLPSIRPANANSYIVIDSFGEHSASTNGEGSQAVVSLMSASSPAKTTGGSNEPARLAAPEFLEDALDLTWQEPMLSAAVSW
jgi:hypothetical protein